MNICSFRKHNIIDITDQLIFFFRFKKGIRYPCNDPGGIFQTKECYTASVNKIVVHCMI